MSYDIELGVKVADTDFIVAVATPEYDSPTYNVGQMIRACTGWDFKQGEWYKLIDVVPMIEKGIHEMRFNRHKYKKYLPDNGWGSYGTVEKSLTSILKCAEEFCWSDEMMEKLYPHLYVRW